MFQTATIAHTMPVLVLLQAAYIELDIASVQVTAHKRLVYANKLW